MRTMSVKVGTGYQKSRIVIYKETEFSLFTHIFTHRETHKNVHTFVYAFCDYRSHNSEENSDFKDWGSKAVKSN